MDIALCRLCRQFRRERNWTRFSAPRGGVPGMARIKVPKETLRGKTLRQNCNIGVGADFRVPVDAAEQRIKKSKSEPPDRARGALCAPGEFGSRRRFFDVTRGYPTTKGFSGRANLRGVLLFGDFLLDKQEKVTCCRSATGYYYMITTDWPPAPRPLTLPLDSSPPSPAWPAPATTCAPCW